MKRRFFDNGDGEAVVVGGGEGTGIVDLDVMDVFVERAGELALGIRDGEGGESGAQGGVFGGGEKDGEVGGAAWGELGFDGHSFWELVVLEDDVTGGVLAGDVGDDGEVVAAWDDNGPVLLTVVVSSIGKLGAEAGGAGGDLDDVGVVGATPLEMVGDYEVVVVIGGSSEFEFGVRLLAVVVGTSRGFFADF